MKYMYVWNFVSIDIKIQIANQKFRKLHPKHYNFKKNITRACLINNGRQCGQI